MRTVLGVNIVNNSIMTALVWSGPTVVPGPPSWLNILISRKDKDLLGFKAFSIIISSFSIVDKTTS